MVCKTKKKTVITLDHAAAAGGTKREAEARLCVQSSVPCRAVWGASILCVVEIQVFFLSPLRHRVFVSARVIVCATAKYPIEASVCGGGFEGAVEGGSSARPELATRSKQGRR